MSSTSSQELAASASGLKEPGCEQSPSVKSNLTAAPSCESTGPTSPIYEDVRNLTADQLRADGIIPDVICGGFPCQDISDAGKRVGIEGARSGLWHEYARLIGEVAPAWVIIENVPALRARGLDTVLRQLASLGRDAEWHCVPASAAGARHRRDRIWIVSHAKGVTERPGLRTDEPTALGWGRSCNLHSAQHSWASEPTFVEWLMGFPCE
jgi:DNA (cytosine-5)-methyltransferase 1